MKKMIKSTSAVTASSNSVNLDQLIKLHDTLDDVFNILANMNEATWDEAMCSDLYQISEDKLRQLNIIINELREEN